MFGRNIIINIGSPFIKCCSDISYASSVKF